MQIFIWLQQIVLSLILAISWQMCSIKCWLSRELVLAHTSTHLSPILEEKGKKLKMQKKKKKIRKRKKVLVAWHQKWIWRNFFSKAEFDQDWHFHKERLQLIFLSTYISLTTPTSFSSLLQILPLWAELSIVNCGYWWFIYLFFTT